MAGTQAPLWHVPSSPQRSSDEHRPPSDRASPPTHVPAPSQLSCAVQVFRSLHRLPAGFGGTDALSLTVAAVVERASVAVAAPRPRRSRVADALSGAVAVGVRQAGAALAALGACRLRSADGAGTGRRIAGPGEDAAPSRCAGDARAGVRRVQGLGDEEHCDREEEAAPTIRQLLWRAWSVGSRVEASSIDRSDRQDIFSVWSAFPRRSDTEARSVRHRACVRAQTMRRVAAHEY